MLHGYGGHILRVDLTTGHTRREKTDPSFMLDVIGGRGFNSTRLYNELPRDVDPLSPDNMLLIGVGPLTGSLLSASAYMTISGKSPMTGILGDSAAGGFMGPEIKQAGYDQIVMTGCCEKPCYLFIADESLKRHWNFAHQSFPKGVVPIRRPCQRGDSGGSIQSKEQILF
jgi:aldehyde:ferredoxin oxidoreductase